MCENPSYISEFINYPYKLDEFQLKSIDAIYNDKHVLVTAHTSAGKSTIAEFAIAYFTQQNKRVIYTSPIKALSNQKFNDIKHNCVENKKFPRLDQTNVGILTGDFQINPDALVIVATTEIIYNYLYSNMPFFDNVGAIIFDEVHYISDPDRGHVWEGSIAMMPENIIMVMLSATIPRAIEFASWVTSVKGKETVLVSTDYRPVPLKHSIYWEGEITTIHDGRKYTEQYDNIKIEIEKQKRKKYDKKNTTQVYESVFHLSDAGLLPAFYFCFSRRQCHTYARSIKQSLVLGEVATRCVNRYHQLLQRYLDEKNRFIDQVLEIEQYLTNGVAIHHSGLLPVLKEIIEILFSEGYIRVLFVTETFAVGINMPSKCVVMTSLEKHDGRQFRYLRTDEYQQIAGRAGRRGLDTIGHCIILVLNDLPESHTIKHLIMGEKPSVMSRFDIDRLFVIQSLKSPFQKLLKTIENTFFHRELCSHIEKYKKEQSDLEETIVKNQSVIDVLIKKDIDEYQVLKQKSENCKQNKEKRRLIKQMEELSEKYNHNQWKYNLSIYDKTNDLTSQIVSISEKINELENYEKNILNWTIKYLMDEGYIKQRTELIVNDDDDTTENCSLVSSIGLETLTLKGVVCSNFHECPPYLMTELMFTTLFDDLTSEEIAGVLAYMIEEKESPAIVSSDLEGVDHRRAELIEKGQENIEHLKTVLDQISEINNRIRHTFERSVIPNTNIHLPVTGCVELSKCMVQYGFMWSSGNSLSEIMTIANVKIDYGNFVKNMMKLYNMVQEIKTACQVLNRDELERKLIILDSKILRDIVHIDSIYLQI